MDPAVIRFQRPFQVWQYLISHGQLLLRSTRSASLESRVDVLFKDVAAMLLRTAYEGLTIRHPTDEERELIVRLTGLTQGRGRTFYVVDSLPIGFVVAGSVTWAEDQLDYSEPSTLIPLP
jgi:hypothetical protein